jgi:hypothetical protein
MRIPVCVLVAACAAGMSGLVRAQGQPIELDRILGEVNNRIITSSDVRQARVLHLVPDVSSDETVRRALEERLLILGEISRGAPVAVTDVEVAARRAAWEARAGGRDRAAALAADAGMSEPALQTWMRDDARIQAYLQHQFGAMPDPQRPRATTDWLLRLRQRAGLP